MLELLKQEADMTLTENRAVTYSTTGSDCLDLFASIGALRNAADEEIIARFVRAYTENADTAMKLLFFARDIRGGLGERRVFRTIFTWLAENKPDSVKKNLEYVAEYGRFDDLLSLFGTPCEKEMLLFIRRCFEKDMERLEAGEAVSLLAKWLPSVNTSSQKMVHYGKKVARALEMNDAAYRKALTKLRAAIRILENNLREKDYSFDYEKQPSRALFKYRKAFERNDGERYRNFLMKVSAGQAELHMDNVAPYELVESCFSRDDGWFGRTRLRELNLTQAAAVNASWAALPDFGCDEDAIAVIDTSGSMYSSRCPSPAAVALSLGLYFAERNKGRFRNHFITFSERPQMIEIKGETFTDKLRYITTFNEVADTNLEAVFELILNTAVKYQLPQEELPAKLVIISDMEFNYCMRNASLTNFENARERFAEKGYKLPDVIFWNVASRNRQQPVTRNEQGAALVSGATPRIFSMIAGGKLSPYSFMMEVLNNERYAGIAA